MVGMSRRRIATLVIVALAVACAVWSYRAGGIVKVLLATASEPQYGIEALRGYVLSWGVFAPAAYVLAVTLEVLIAPFPGTLLYAPGGAIFGGFVGGTLSLAGNVLGATIAAAIGRGLGEDWVTRRSGRAALDRHRKKLMTRAPWIIFLLRVNPLTSSDLVSYVAGAVGVPVRVVALGTFAGMAPLCYVQSYLAATIFTYLPAGVWIVVGVGIAYVVVVSALLFRRRPEPSSEETWPDDTAFRD
jgi:uncharacterized membrane protein YdjX (TVP38/TMEM64 family)